MRWRLTVIAAKWDMWGQQTTSIKIAQTFSAGREQPLNAKLLRWWQRRRIVVIAAKMSQTWSAGRELQLPTQIVMAMNGDGLLLLLQAGICEGSKRQTIRHKPSVRKENCDWMGWHAVVEEGSMIILCADKYSALKHGWHGYERVCKGYLVTVSKSPDYWAKYECYWI